LTPSIEKAKEELKDLELWRKKDLLANCIILIIRGVRVQGVALAPKTVQLDQIMDELSKKRYQKRKETGKDQNKRASIV
jgi:hypothetical protein